jgi:hypothetical protein
MLTTLANPELARQTPDNAPWIFWRDAGSPRTRQGFAAMVFGCANPACECTEATLQGLWVDARLRSVRSDGERMELDVDAVESTANGLQPASGTQTVIRVDYRSGAVHTSEPPSAAEAELAQWLRGASDDALLAQLRRAVESNRKQPAPVADLFDGWEPGDLVSCPRAFPGAELPLVVHAGRRWLLEDLHCIDPACGCTDVRMVVFDVDRAESGDGSSLAGSFVVTLPSLQAIDAATENGLLPGAAALRALWQQAIAEQPELVAQLEARRQKMKTLTPPRGSHPAPARRRAVPGRNDPCPCGSGKKWKKCCGA